MVAEVIEEVYDVVVSPDVIVPGEEGRVTSESPGPLAGDPLSSQHTGAAGVTAARGPWGRTCVFRDEATNTESPSWTLKLCSLLLARSPQTASLHLGPLCKVPRGDPAPCAHPGGLCRLGCPRCFGVQQPGSVPPPRSKTSYELPHVGNRPHWAEPVTHAFSCPAGWGRWTPTRPLSRPTSAQGPGAEAVLTPAGSSACCPGC